MPEKPIKFTAKDIFMESFFQLWSDHDLFGAIQIIITGILYNRAKDSGNPERIAIAYDNLHPEIKLFKHNFLNREKKHW